MYPTFASCECPEKILDVIQNFLPPRISIKELLSFGSILAGGSVAYALQYADCKTDLFTPKQTGLWILPDDIHRVIQEYCIYDHEPTMQAFSPCKCCQRWDCGFCRDKKVYKSECNDVDIFLSPEHARLTLDYVLQHLDRSEFTIRIKDTSLTEVDFANINGTPCGKVASVLNICFARPTVKQKNVLFPYHYKTLQLVCIKDHKVEELLSRFDFDYLQCAIVKHEEDESLHKRKRKRDTQPLPKYTLIQSSWSVQALQSREIRYLKNDYYGVTRFQYRVRKALRKGFSLVPNIHLPSSRYPYIVYYFFECFQCQQEGEWDELEELRISKQESCSEPCRKHSFYSENDAALRNRLGVLIDSTQLDIEFAPLLDVLCYGEEERIATTFSKGFIDLTQSTFE